MNLTAVAYEGTSVRTQTRVERTVQFRNTALFGHPLRLTLPVGTNGNLAFGIALIPRTSRQIELFRRAEKSRRPHQPILRGTCRVGHNAGAGAAILSYAIITHGQWHQFQTPNDLGTSPGLAIKSDRGRRRRLSWTAIAGRPVRHFGDDQSLPARFKKIGSVLATNTQAQWPILHRPPAPSSIKSPLKL